MLPSYRRGPLTFPTRSRTKEIVNGAAIQAKIPMAVVRKQEAGRVGCATTTMDCVVSVFGFSGGVSAGTTTSKELASEVARVLKPGGSLLFVEKGEARELVRTKGKGRRVDG